MNAHHPHTMNIDLFSVFIQDPDVAKSLLGAKSQVSAMSSRSLKTDLIYWFVRRLAQCIKDTQFETKFCFIQFLLTCTVPLSPLIDCVVGCSENELVKIEKMRTQEWHCFTCWNKKDVIGNVIKKSSSLSISNCCTYKHYCFIISILRVVE